MVNKIFYKSKKMLAVLVAVAVIGTASISDAWVGVAIRVIASAWKVCPPEVKAQIASAAVHVGVFVAGALMYSLKPSGDGSHKADGNGIKRTANVTWIDLNDGKTVKQSDTTAKVSHSDLKQKVQANPSKYPKLNSALKVNIDKSNVPGAIGQKFTQDGNEFQITNRTPQNVYVSDSSPYDWRPYVLPDGYYGGGAYVFSRLERSSSTAQQVITYQSSPTGASTVVSREATTAEFVNKIRNGAPANVYSDYYGEIDDFIQSNPNVVHFVDPEDETTPAVPEYASLAKQAAVAAADNTISAQAAADSAQTAATNARARANADPTNSALANAADRAEAAALAAKQKLDEAFAAEKKAEVEAEKENGAKSSVGSDGTHDAYGVPGERDFGTRISSFINNIRNSALFSLPSRILGDVPGGGSPVQTINMGTRFGTHTLDWSKFDPVWTVLRAVFLICMGVSCVKIVTRGGSG